MTRVFFSANTATRGFYFEDSSNLPSDIIEIEFELYDSIMKGQTLNTVVGVDAQGLPCLVPKPLAPLAVRVDVATQRRQRAYQKESDPLYFQVQRGEISQETWLAKIEEIKARYPIPTE